MINYKSQSTNAESAPAPAIDNGVDVTVVLGLSAPMPVQVEGVAWAGLSGGSDATWFRVLTETWRGETTYYPAIVDGVEKRWSEFADIGDYFAAKHERRRRTIRVTVAGNPISAASAISAALGCKAMACSPNTVDIYPDFKAV